MTAREECGTGKQKSRRLRSVWGTREGNEMYDILLNLSVSLQEYVASKGPQPKPLVGRNPWKRIGD